MKQIKPLRANPHNGLTYCRRIVWVCLTIFVGLALKWLKCFRRHTPLDTGRKLNFTKLDINWRSKDVQDVFWTSYVCSVYYCVQGVWLVIRQCCKSKIKTAANGRPCQGGFIKMRQGYGKVEPQILYKHIN